MCRSGPSCVDNNIKHFSFDIRSIFTILLTKITGAQNGLAISYHKVRGLYFLAEIFVRSI